MRRPLTPFDSATVVPATTVVAGTVVIFLLGGLLNPGPPRPYPNDYGIARCPDGAQENLLSFRALQCWFDASHGRWRMLSRVAVYEALVVEAQATDLLDADEIARQLVAAGDGRFAEVLVYVQSESAADPTLIRRIRWTRQTGFETLQFMGRPVR
jgi:hypothetical protein